MPIIETKSTPYTNAIAILVVSVLIAAGVGFFMLLPMNKERNTSIEQLNQKKTSSESIQSLNSQAKQSFATLQKNQSVIDRMDLALPAKPNVTDIKAHIESMAQASTMSLKNIVISDPDASSGPVSGQATAPATAGAGAAQTLVDPSIPNLKILPIQIDIAGSYDALNNFLSNLEQSLLLMDVQKIDVSSDSSSSDLRYTIKLNSYYYGQ